MPQTSLYRNGPVRATSLSRGGPQRRAGRGGGYDAAVRVDQPVAYFKLDEAAGGTGTVVADSSGNGRDCTANFSSGSASLANVTTATAGGLEGIGPSMNFRNALTGGGTVSVRDGTPSTSLRMTTGGMTFEFWWVRSLAGFQWLLFNGVTNGLGNTFYEIRQDASGTRFELKARGATTNFTTATHGIADTTMRHIVLVVNAARTSVELFVDGASRGTAAVVGTWDPGGSGETFYIGERPDQAVRSHLNNVAVYNSALSPARIAAHYAARDAG